MTLENTFYVMAIICMTLGIVILLTLVVAVLYIKQRVTEMEKAVREKMDIISNVAAHPGEAAVGIGASLAEAAIERVKTAFAKKRSRKN